MSASRSSGVTTLTGRAYLARSSNQIAASLDVGPSTVTLRSDTGQVLADFPRDTLKFEAPLGQSDRRATLPDGTLFETSDHEAVQSITGKTAGDALHSAERFNSRLIFFVVGAVIGGFLVWRFALPAIVYVAVALTPQPLKDAMDAGTLQAFDRIVADPTRLSDERQAEVRDVFAKLIGELEDPNEGNFVLHFRSAPGIGPNAVALPGGTVVVTDALVNKFPGNDVVAAVLGHELGHVVENHGLTQLYRSLGFFVLVSLIAGDTGPILEDVLLEGGVILSLSYSREFERRADEFGLRLTQDAGYDPAALITFFESLPGSFSEQTSWDSTHPSSGERINSIREFLEAN